MDRHRVTLDPTDCIHYYCNQQTGGGSYFSSEYPIQRGFGFFGNLRRYVIPLMLKAGKYLGKKLLSSGQGIIEDVSQGKSFRDAARDRLHESGRNIKEDILQKLQSGRGVKRLKSTPKNQFKRRKRCTKDIFS